MSSPIHASTADLSRVKRPIFKSFLNRQKKAKPTPLKKEDSLDYGEDIVVETRAEYNNRVRAQDFALSHEWVECDCGQRRLTLREKLRRLLAMLRCD